MKGIEAADFNPSAYRPPLGDFVPAPLLFSFSPSRYKNQEQKTTPKHRIKAVFLPFSNEVSTSVRGGHKRGYKTNSAD